VSSVANLLQQILYSRRGFPFYSFCVVAGLIPTTITTDSSSSSSPGTNSNNKKKKKTRIMEGAVYVYDAIGSYERVAVGSAGTGRELLQPILDQLFSESVVTTTSSNNNTNDDNNGKSSSSSSSCNDNDNNILPIIIPPVKQRVGVAGSLRPPVPTTIVSCTVEDAVRKVTRAYLSVAEREISVGDEVVIICVVRSSSSTTTTATTTTGVDGEELVLEGGGSVLKVYRYPLKKH
jgi:20S proteasome alpha/beta subunit